MLRRIILAVVATGAIGLTFAFSQTAYAQTNYCWIDAKTGSPYPVLHIPAGSQVKGNFSGDGPPVVPGDVTIDPDGVHAFNSKTGQNLVKQPDGTWIDAQSGQPYPTLDVPAGSLVKGNFSGDGPPVVPGDVTIDPDGVHAFNSKTGQNLVKVPCPPTDASTMPPIQSGMVPGGVLVPGGDKGGTDTPDKPGGSDTKTTDTKPTDTKTPDTKTTDTKTPSAPVKDDKPKKADTPKTPQTGKAATAKDRKLSKSTAEKQSPKGTRYLTGPKTATAHKTMKSAATKTKEKKPEGKTQIHIEFFSTGGRMGGFGR